MIKGNGATDWRLRSSSLVTQGTFTVPNISYHKFVYLWKYLQKYLQTKIGGILMAVEKGSKMNSNDNRTGIEQRSNCVRSENEQKSNSKNSGRSERELEVEILSYEIELDQYKKWYYQAKRELEVERQKNQPLVRKLQEIDIECGECAKKSAQQYWDLKAAYQNAITKINKLKQENKDLSENRSVWGSWSDNDKLTKLLRRKEEQIEEKNAEIEELKLQLANVLGRAGRQPIDQDIIDKIIKYKNEGYSYDKIAIYAGVSKSTVSKYIAKYS